MPKLKGKSKASSDIHILEKFLQTYEKHCIGSQSCVSTTIKQGLKKCIAIDKLITKFVLANVAPSLRNLKPVSLTPLLRTIRDERYRLGKDLCVRGIQLNPQDVANLAILLELDGRTTYPFTKLEITHTKLDLWSMERLGVALPYSNLSSLVLDYSRCGDNGVKKLISGLEGNTKLLALSLCYCDLGPQSGSALGTIVARTAICNLYINGNSLQCMGATKLLKPIADFAELGQERRANGSLYSNYTAHQNPAVANEEGGINSKVVSLNATSKTDMPITLESTGKKKKRKGLKKKIKKLDPGPWLTKLHLVDNAIDKRLNQTEKSVMEFIQLLIWNFYSNSWLAPHIPKRPPDDYITLFVEERHFEGQLVCLIKNSEHLVEIDINGNAIGEQCAVKILEAVKDRKKEEMPGLKIKVTPQISSATFREIFKSCSKPSPTKKRKKKKIK